MSNPEKFATIYEMLRGAEKNLEEVTGQNLSKVIHNCVSQEFRPYRDDGHTHEELDAIIVDELAIFQDQTFLAVDQYINAVGTSIKNHNKPVNIPYMVSAMASLYSHVWGAIIAAYLQNSEDGSIDVSALIGLMKDFQNQQSAFCLKILETNLDKLNISAESKEKLNHLFELKALSDAFKKLAKEASASNDSTGEDETPSRI